MNLRQLTAFRAVMLTGSVSNAARSLNRTQPTISAMITSLEDEIGYPLFERRGRRLHPLPEADFLFEEAEAVLDRLQSAERIAKKLKNLEFGSIKIVAMTGASIYLLPDLVSRFLEDRDDVKVSLIARSAVQVERLVSAQQFDLGFADLNHSGAEASPLVNHDIHTLRCLCAIPAPDALAQKDEITPSDLDGRPLGTLYDPHPTVKALRESFEASKAHMHIRIQTLNFFPLLTFAERGQCYAMVDPLTAENYARYWRDPTSLVFRPISPAVYLPVSIMTPSHNPPPKLVSEFAIFLRDEIQGISRAYSTQ